VKDGDLDEAQVAHLLHGAPRAQVGGIEPLVVAHHEGHARLAHRPRDLFRLGQAEGQRLLDEQRLARGEEVQHGVAVAAGGEESTASTSFCSASSRPSLKRALTP
jgi:hypothetical protein